MRQNDVYDFPVYDGKMPYLIDEVGGIKWTKNQDKANSDTQSWGYGVAPKTEKEFLQRLEGQINAILDLKDQVWGYCYTQLTDVEQEQNGVYYYDRTPKFDTQLIHDIFSKNPEDLEGTYSNPLSDYGPDPWALWHDGSYYYMHTMIDSLVLWKTKDVTDIRNAERKLFGFLPILPTSTTYGHRRFITFRANGTSTMLPMTAIRTIIRCMCLKMQTRTRLKVSL